MEFYQAIANHYDKLFPLSPKKLEFCRHNLEAKPQTLLDIGCATGDLCLALAQEGRQITGLDADKHMIQIATSKGRGNHSTKFINGDMQELHRHFSPSSLDGAFCFGNTMAHLQGPAEIENFLQHILGTLKPGAVFLGQLVNYEKILTKNIEELPLIDRGGVTFKRRYSYDLHRRSILFSGELTLKKSGQTLQTSTNLYPLTKNELRQLLDQTGFRQITFYGDFNKTPYSSDSGALVFKAKKISQEFVNP